MGWSIGYDTRWKRDIGYGVIAWCDFPGCMAVIDRGLAYVCCGEEPYGGDHGCGLYFCEKHHQHFRWNHAGVCSRCYNYRPPFVPKPDHPEWVRWKMTHESWSLWRKGHPQEVAAWRAAYPEVASGVV